MKIYFFVVLIFLNFAIIQFSILPFLVPKGVFPNLILILSFCLAILFNKHKTLIFAWLGALIFFIFFIFNLILIISVFVILSLILNIFFKRFFHNFKITAAILFVLIGIFFYRIIMFLMNYLTEYSSSLNWKILFLEVFYSAILSFFIFATFKKFIESKTLIRK